MKLIGLDLGKGYTKIFDGTMLKTLPSVIGHPERIKYQDGLGQAPSPAAGIHLKTAGGEFYVGDLALTQSSLSWTMMDRIDVANQMKLVLTLAALSEINGRSGVPIKLVTGVPVNWFGQKQDLIDLLSGDHAYSRDGKTRQVTIEEVVVVTEPHGAAYSKTIDGEGNLINRPLAGGRFGIIDIGMYTTDFLVLEKLGYLEPASGSLQVGMSQVYEIVARQIQTDFGIQDLEPHQVDKYIRSGKITVSGVEHSLADVVEPALQALARKIMARAIALPSPLWKNGGGELLTIFIAGGGAHHLGPYLTRPYPHADILAGAATANVRGFYNAACYKWLPKQQPKKSTRAKTKSMNGAMANGG
jgi:hypothetical protein